MSKCCSWSLVLISTSQVVRGSSLQSSSSSAFASLLVTYVFVGPGIGEVNRWLQGSTSGASGFGDGSMKRAIGTTADVIWPERGSSPSLMLGHSYRPSNPISAEELGSIHRGVG